MCSDKYAITIYRKNKIPEKQDKGRTDLRHYRNSIEEEGSVDLAI